MDEREGNGILYKVNTMGYSLLTLGLLGVDMLNSLGMRQVNGEWLGSLTNHVGDIIHGSNAALYGGILGIVFKEKTLGLAVTAAWFASIIFFEMKGIGNVSDSLDLLGIALGLISGAILLERGFGQRFYRPKHNTGG